MKSSEVGINVGVVLDGLGNLVLVSTGIIKVGAVCPSAKKIDALETTKKTILKSGDAEALRALQEEHPEIALIGLGNRVQCAVSKLNKLADLE